MAEVSATTFSEQTRFDASLTENLTPSGSGTLKKNDSASVSLTHRFSDTLTGRLGASYTRTIFPGALSEFNNYSYSGEIGYRTDSQSAGSSTPATGIRGPSTRAMLPSQGRTSSS